ncbi:hypothetical protein AMS68_002441 [Peltaster fructicola]|uniref:Uncharacterized protein n=1 Tax=Peltaster fructicola TaxID=286661 RepID=A0A6H0XQB3_9PEZI|nr:hypothetical protein AMS68_002441 [Peltaster fructicola]
MTEQTFSFETVACLLAVLESNKITLGTKHYELMAKLDGKRSHHGFQHQFRKVKARAKELQKELSSTNGTPRPTPTKKSITSAKASASKKRKNFEEDDDAEQGSDIEQKQEQAVKKVKPETPDEEKEFFHFVVEGQALYAFLELVARGCTVQRCCTVLLRCDLPPDSVYNTKKLTDLSSHNNTEDDVTEVAAYHDGRALLTSKSTFREARQLRSWLSFIGLLCIPAAIGLYTISQPGKNGEQAYFSRVITQVYADYAKKNEERNTLHTDAIEQAAADRALFLNHSTANAKHIDLRFYDQFNNGAPHNIPAGHGHANIDAVIEKYQREAYEANERKLQQIRDNNVPCEQPLKTTMPKVTPGIADS